MGSPLWLATAIRRPVSRGQRLPDGRRVTVGCLELSAIRLTAGGARANRYSNESLPNRGRGAGSKFTPEIDTSTMGPRRRSSLPKTPAARSVAARSEGCIGGEHRPSPGHVRPITWKCRLYTTVTTAAAAGPAWNNGYNGSQGQQLRRQQPRLCVLACVINCTNEQTLNAHLQLPSRHRWHCYVRRLSAFREREHESSVVLCNLITHNGRDAGHRPPFRPRRATAAAGRTLLKCLSMPIPDSAARACSRSCFRDCHRRLPSAASQPSRR